MFWVPGDYFFGARNFSDFSGFSTSPNIASCCAPGTSGIRDFHFLLGVGIRAPHSVIRRLGAGIQSLESGIAACGSPTRPSISTYSRSTAPAAVMLLILNFFVCFFVSGVPSLFLRRFCGGLFGTSCRSEFASAVPLRRNLLLR